MGVVCEMLSADRRTGIATGMLTFTAGSALCYPAMQGTQGTAGTLCVLLRGLRASAHSCLLVLGSTTARWEDRDSHIPQHLGDGFTPPCKMGFLQVPLTMTRHNNKFFTGSSHGARVAAVR